MSPRLIPEHVCLPGEVRRGPGGRYRACRICGRRQRVLDYPALGVGDTIDGLRATVAYLRRCVERRAAYSEHRPRDLAAMVSYTSDPAWIVDVAINRRAGWPDDPGTTLGSAVPVKRWHPGIMVAPILQFPKRGSGDQYVSGEMHPQTVARINSRSVVREREVPKRYRARLVHRLHTDDDF